MSLLPFCIHCARVPTTFAQEVRALERDQVELEHACRLRDVTAAEKPWIAPSSSQTQNVELSKSQSTSGSITAGFDGRFSRTANRISEMRGRSARVAFRITVLSAPCTIVASSPRPSGAAAGSTLFAVGTMTEKFMRNISLRTATSDDAAFALHVTEACGLRFG